MATPTSAAPPARRPQPRARGCARASREVVGATARPRRLAERLPAAGVPHERVHRLGEGSGIVRRHDQPRSADGLGPRHVRHHESRTARHRLEQHERHALPPRGRHDDVGGAQMGNGVVDVADPLDAVGHGEARPSSRSRSPPWLSPPTKRSLAEGSATLASAAIATSCPFCSLRRPAQTNRGCSGLAVGEHPVGMEVERSTPFGITRTRFAARPSTRRPRSASSSDTATIAPQSGARARLIHRYRGAHRPPTNHDQ